MVFLLSMFQNLAKKIIGAKVDDDSSSSDDNNDGESLLSEIDFDSIPASNVEERFEKNVVSFGITQTVIKKIEFSGNGEYIKGKWKKNQLLEIYSFKILHPYITDRTIYVRKQSPGHLLTYDETDFIARINFENITEVEFSQSFSTIKKSILQKIKIIEIIRDKLQDNIKDAYETFINFMRNRSIAKNFEYAEDFFQLSLKFEKWNNYDNISILTDIDKNEHISCDLKKVARTLIQKLQHAKENVLFPKDKFTLNLLSELCEICEHSIRRHKTILYDKYKETICGKASSALQDHFESLNDTSILCIRIDDIKLFADLLNLMGKKPFTNIINNSWDALFKVVQTKQFEEGSSLKQFMPLIHPIYYNLCKSFQELVKEINGITDISIDDLLEKVQQEDVENQNLINWPSNSPKWFPFLQKQYYLIFNLMKHFEPGNYSNVTKFQYDFNSKPSCQHIKKLFADSSIPEERLIWIYILNDSIGDILDQNLDIFETLLEGYTSYIILSKNDYYESFRILTYNTAKFIARTSLYLSSKLVPESDQAALEKQRDFINKFIVHKEFDDFRDLIDVFNEYWTNKEEIIENLPNKFPNGKFKQDLEGLRRKLLDIVNIVLSKEAKAQGFIKYFRSFNAFLEDLNSIEFNNWFIKDELMETEILMLINKDKKSYKVLDPENYIKKHGHKRHYIIEIIEDLLNSIISFLSWSRTWAKDDNLTLSGTSELLLAISKSFLYLKEQPDYVSFDTFKIESTKPFDAVINNSSSYDDFTKRIEIIGKSFWYLRKQDEIDIDKAVCLCQEINESIDTEILTMCYKKYLDKFNYYIETTISQNFEEKIKFTTEEVKEQLKLIETLKFSEWTEDLKREFLPELLSGLAAVWSIQESKDIISTTGKVLKPHCIQILCILRLLSVEKNSKGIDKQLAQILTGQGKSLVFGLLSVLLALMDHEVRIACYSEYLAKRDQHDFKEFFKVFNVKEKIIYYTFKSMANEILEPNVNEEKKSLRDLVEDRILNHSTKQVGKIEHHDISNTILLIDEVDVFFCDEFYGNVYRPVELIKFPALCNIQQKIWETVKGCSNKERDNVLKIVNDLIDAECRNKNKEFIEFNKFCFKPGTYKLLKEQNNEIIEKEYTNQQLYEEHLVEMVDTAIAVANGAANKSYYKINDGGLIEFRDEFGVYSTSYYRYYYNIFNYFRLKETTFDHKNYQNYGYFLAHCGQISYANLPEKYPLILGVSGTLSDLNHQEKKAIREYYNINNISFMPSFFGCSNLKFDKCFDFTIKDSESEWLDTIFNKSYAKINFGLSVLIFFETDIELNKFFEKFFHKFDRMNILTENTEEQKKQLYIDEAGITKTITLATKGMGRGVDFKSSVVVEAKGGMHVIQSFFSLDIKEETQIKGRTARKDNKGSYELILCHEYLEVSGLNEGESYDVLNNIRKVYMEKQGQNNKEKIERSKKKHEKTMKYFESFFK